jgi:hypothetical protein
LKLSYFKYDSVLVTALKQDIAYKYYFPNITERIISSKNKIEVDILQLDEFKHPMKMNFITDMPYTYSVDDIILISNSTSVVLPTFIDNGITRNSFVCISNTNKVILPASIVQTVLISGQYTTTLTFSEAFSGTIFINTETGVTTENVVGLFAIVQHDLDRLPQVELDSSVAGILNDIRYIDRNRLEISFKSEVDTTITLVAAPGV